MLFQTFLNYKKIGGFERITNLEKVGSALKFIRLQLLYSLGHDKLFACKEPTIT